MLNADEVTIQNIIVHKIGSRPDEEGVTLSNSPVEITDENTLGLLQHYFLAPFKPGELFHLTHDEDINLNPVYAIVANLFSSPAQFTELSQDLANHLYDQSIHPKIKPGELYVVYLGECFIEGETVDAIGLFKSESKEVFLKVSTSQTGFEIGYENGININKLDKGCIIYNLEAEKGYLVSIVDSVNKGEEALYWRNDFLHIKTRRDEYLQTKSYLDMCKTFVLEQAPKEFDISKTDQTEFINKSANYFKKNEEFTFEEFADTVIEQPEVKESFKEYKKQYEVAKDVELEEEFVISAPAVKKEAKTVKNVIKLDKNFHIYVHGKRELITKGFDEGTGMNYYQLYFKEEE